METKQCKKCKEIKSTNEFSKSSKSKNGFYYYCKLCKHKDDAISRINRKQKRDSVNFVIKYKLCLTCNTEKLIENFHKDRSSKDNYAYDCKQCAFKRRKDYSLKNHEKEQKYKQEYRNINKYKLELESIERDKDIRRRYSHWKANAKIREISWELDMNYIINLPLICYYTGDVLTTERNKLNTISLDRLDSSKGYVKDNVVLCCKIVNYMKRDFSEKEFKDFCFKICNH